jgi:hypothetical protein
VGHLYKLVAVVFVRRALGQRFDAGSKMGDNDREIADVEASGAFVITP